MDRADLLAGCSAALVKVQDIVERTRPRRY